MSRSAAILQSNYIPWKGYFDLIRAVDVFVFLDEVQYTKNDWRNRNQIKTKDGVKWLTIPAGADLSRKICEVEVDDQRWKAKHRRTIEQSYCKAPFFQQQASLLDDLYENELTNLSEYNQATIRRLCSRMGITTELIDSRELGYAPSDDRTVRLVHILRELDADSYLSGPSAREYIDDRVFQEAGIACRFVDYRGYPEYGQCHGGFVHAVSVIDLIFNTGPKAGGYMRDLCA